MAVHENRQEGTGWGTVGTKPAVMGGRFKENSYCSLSKTVEEILCIVINSHSISVRVFLFYFTDEEIEPRKIKWLVL